MNENGTGFHCHGRVQQIAWALLVLFACLCGVARAFGQTVQPVIDENVVAAPGKKASGMVQYVNNSGQPLNVILNLSSFSVAEDGSMQFRPLDPNIHVKLSTMSFRVAPGQIYDVFYEASADQLPTWFVIYGSFSGFRQRSKQGFKIQVQLPHVVYLLPKEKLAREEVSLQRAVYKDGNVTVSVQNSGAMFGRAVETDILSSSGKIVQNRFALFPSSVRTLQIRWEQHDAPLKVVVRFEHFTVEQPVSTRAE
jgi:hypothetical protein